MVTCSQTVEFVETRAAKVTGQRAPFEGRVMTESQQETYFLHRDDAIQDQTEELDRKEQEDRTKQMMQLDKMVESYSIDNFRNEISDEIEETREETLYMSQAHNR